MNHRYLASALVLLFLAANGHAQSKAVRAQNQQLIDSLRNDIVTAWCSPQGLMAAKPYPARNTKELKEFLQTLNSVYTDGLSESDILEKVRKYRNTRNKEIDSVPIGLMQVVTCRVWVPDYLHVDIHLTCLDGQVLARRFELKPMTIRWCVNRSEKFYDMDYLDEVYVPLLNFPLRNMPFAYLYSERLSPETIRRAAAAHPEYRWVFPDDAASDTLSRTLAGQYYRTQGDKLYWEKADRRFLSLVRGGDVATLTTLLYSPNYFYAVSAMHSLNYLKSTGKVEFTPELSGQLQRVKNAHFQIEFQTSDASQVHESYSEIDLKDDWFIWQYGQALQGKLIRSSAF